jgi:hypothetical protein
MESLAQLLLDPRRLADLGPTEEELLADLTWPASGDGADRDREE